MSAEILALGAILVDHIHFVKEEELYCYAHSKGGMELLSEADLAKILENPHFKSQAVPGGSAVNTLKGLQQIGHKGLIFGKRGNDRAGARVEEMLQNMGIQTHIGLGTLPTGHVICFVTPDGERTMRTFLGSNQELALSDITSEPFKKARLIHIEGYTLIYSITLDVMKRARKHGVKVSFDLASFQIVENFKQDILQLLPYIDILFANEQEAFTLTGLPPKEACEYLQTQVPISIVMVNIDGAYIGHQGILTHVPALRITPKDTTGAGDLFASGFLHGYLKGLPLPEAGHIGSKAAHEVVQILGAQLPTPTWQNILTN